MKKSVKSNIFGFGSEAMWERYGAVLDGARLPAACVVSMEDISAAARNALEKSFARLGFGEEAVAYVTLSRLGDSGKAAGEKSLFAIMEGLDPIAVVATDVRAAERLAAAYRAPVPHDSCSRLFGRTVLAFGDLDRLLESDEGKQRAWALLKMLRISENPR